MTLTVTPSTPLPEGVDIPRPADAGPNFLGMGGTGTGKTYLLRTLLSALRDHFGHDGKLLCIFTEPRWAPLAHLRASDGFHMAYIPPANTSTKDLLASYRAIASVPWSGLSDRYVDPHKVKYTGPFLRMWEMLANFKCGETGEEFGDVSTWPNTWALAVDTLSGVNTMCKEFMVGKAIAVSQPGWGAMMSAEMTLINKLAYETRCTFVLNAHLERLVDEVAGGMITQVMALGRKNAPEIPKNFDDVYLCVKEGRKFSLDTMKPGIDVKPTYFPLAQDIKPDFKLAIDKWQQTIKEGATT